MRIKNKLRRLHLFEFEDQSWFPDFIRQGITDYLQFAANRMNLYKALVPVIQKGLEKTNTKQIIDICSGAGGGILKIHEALKKQMDDYKIILTDKYPNVTSFQFTAKSTEGQIDFVPTSVDATDVPENLKGFRTQFISFHHFKPDAAKKILMNAVSSRAPIAVFEATERNWMNLIGMLFTPFVVMAAMPFIRPLKWSNLFFTFIIPLIPLFTMWDGLVSVMRSYTKAEMEQMTKDLGYYKWEIGKINVKGTFGVTYLFGYPKAA